MRGGAGSEEQEKGKGKKEVTLKPTGRRMKAKSKIYTREKRLNVFEPHFHLLDALRWVAICSFASFAVTFCRCLLVNNDICT